MPEPQQPGQISAWLRCEKILAPWDFSIHGRKGIETAAAIALMFGAELQILHVVEPILYPAELGYAPVLAEEMLDKIQAEAQGELDSLVEQLRAQNIRASGELRLGRPYLEICQAAQEWKADLIVLTTHGHTGLKHVLLGSTAERVIRHAPCPTLVLRIKENPGHSTTANDSNGIAHT